MEKMLIYTWTLRNLPICIAETVNFFFLYERQVSLYLRYMNYDFRMTYCVVLVLIIRLSTGVISWCINPQTIVPNIVLEELEK